MCNFGWEAVRCESDNLGAKLVAPGKIPKNLAIEQTETFDGNPHSASHGKRSCQRRDRCPAWSTSPKVRSGFGGPKRVA